MRILKSVLLGYSAISLALGANAQEQGATKERQTESRSDDFLMSTIFVLGDRTTAEPGSNSVVTAETIAKISADHPAELLNVVPGVNIQLNSGQEHLVSVRSPVLSGGAGQGSFLILQNGVPTRSPAFGNVNMLFEPHYEVADVVEVVRGPASAKYGSNAVHGLINFIQPDASDVSVFELNASASTLGRYKSDILASSDTGYVAVSLMDDQGWRDDTSVGQQKVTARQAFSLGQWDATAWASYTNLNQETAGYIGGYKAYRDRDQAEQNENPEAFRDAKFAMGAIRFERTVDEVQFSVTPYARWQEMEFRQHFLPYKGYEENDSSAIGVMSDVSIERERSYWRFGGMLDFASGSLLETQPEPFGFFPGDSRFPVGVHYDYTVDTFAAALWGEYGRELFPDVMMVAGLRVETHDYDYTTRAPAGIRGRFNIPDDRSDTFDLVTPKLGFIWDDAIGEVDLYLNFARGQRAPQASDLYRLQSQQVVGQVKSETLDSVEFGGRGSALSGRLNFDVAAYAMTKDNFFFRDADGLNVPNGETDHIGVELMADYALTERVSLSGNVSWSEQTYAFDRPSNGIVDGNRIDTAPEWLADLSISWQATDKLELDARAEFVGEYFTDEAASNTYNGHTLFSLRGAYSVSEQLEAFVLIRNLFDLKYADRADFAFGNARYFQGEPMNATFGIRSRW